MNINENLQKWSKIIKNNINEHISAQKPHQTTIVANLISSVIQFDKFFHTLVLYENYFICIFMNINEVLKMRWKTWVNYSMQRGIQT